MCGTNSRHREEIAKSLRTGTEADIKQNFLPSFWSMCLAAHPFGNPPHRADWVRQKNENDSEDRRPAPNGPEADKASQTATGKTEHTTDRRRSDGDVGVHELFIKPSGSDPHRLKPNSTPIFRWIFPFNGLTQSYAPLTGSKPSTRFSLSAEPRTRRPQRKGRASSGRKEMGGGLRVHHVSSRIPAEKRT